MVPDFFFKLIPPRHQWMKCNGRNLIYPATWLFVLITEAELGNELKNVQEME